MRVRRGRDRRGDGRDPDRRDRRGDRRRRECPLSPLAFGAFDLIRALGGGHNDDPAHASRPMDAERDGFVMGEGAGLLVLEAAEVARRRGAAPYAG